MKKLFGLALLLCAAVVFYAPPAQALGLKVAPLDYTVVLKKGEKQKGFIDLSNPAGVTVRVKTSVQAFRQTSDRGTLTFFDDEQVSGGIKPDLDEFELGPREALRMYFLVDGSVLPDGDVFAAIFFTTQPIGKGAGVTELVRLGTLLSVTNGTPGARRAEITELNVASIQFGDSLRGSYTVKNTSNPKTSTGFYPVVTVAVDPFRQEVDQRSRLVFAGRSRENGFELKGTRIGFYKISVGYGDSSKQQWVFVVNGAGFIAVLLVVATVIIGFIWRKIVRRKAVENLRINR